MKLFIFSPLHQSEHGMIRTWKWMSLFHLNPFFVLRRTIRSLHFAQIRIFIYCIPCNDFLCLGKLCFPHSLSMFPSDALSDSVHSVSLTCVRDKKKEKGTVVLLPRCDERLLHWLAFVTAGTVQSKQRRQEVPVWAAAEKTGRAEPSQCLPHSQTLFVVVRGHREDSQFFFPFTVTHLHTAR